MKKELIHKKNILISHQSAIPHYRVPFYNAVAKFKPDWWDFNVVYDGEKQKLFFQETIDHTAFKFNIEKTSTFVFQFLKKRVVFQSFILMAPKYDLLILEQALNNLSYPLALVYRLIGKKIMYWGHGKDFEFDNPGLFKKISEFIKLLMARNGNGFFSYTRGVSEFMISKGYSREKIFCLNNTIDINEHREVFQKIIPERDKLRSSYNLSNSKVLLYVGRLNKRKRFDFLVESFVKLLSIDKNYRLIVIGTGDVSLIEECKVKCGEEAVIYFGAVTNAKELAPIYIMSDVYVFPGDVGLGPLQALCYDLIPIVIDSKTHNPEYEYLNITNAIILQKNSSTEHYANEIHSLFNDPLRLSNLKSNAWSSISYLTIENMAMNFIAGIERILN